MGKRLSDQEIKHRLTKLRNFEQLYPKLKDRLRFKDEIIRSQAEQIKALQSQVQEQAIVIADLQQAVFGKRKRDSVIPEVKAKPKTPPKSRERSSYRRPIPDQSEITNQEHLVLEATCSCGGDLRKTDEITRYTEDIPLPDITPGYQSRLVTQHKIEQGVCQQCGQTQTAGNWDLGGQRVRLGPNLKLLVCSLVANNSLSYTKIINLLVTLYGVKVSSGEIANILAQAAQKWQPVYQDLLNEARGSPFVGIDETTWSIRDLNGRGNAWVLVDGSGLVYLAIRNNRGVAHAKELLKGFEGLRVTDGYAAYSNKDLKGLHQLCWAHLYRSAKDLRYNQNLPQAQTSYVIKWYEGFSNLYANLQAALSQPTDPAKQTTKLQRQLNKLLNSQPDHNGEPVKLTKLKKQLYKASVSNKLFVCLTAGGVCDNNQAERGLRPLVIKRKISFGSISEAGARALATVMTICTNTWHKHPNNYFKALSSLS